MRVWAAQSGFESMLECAAAQRPSEAWDGGLAFRCGGSSRKGTWTIPKKLVPLASVLPRFCSRELRAERILDPQGSKSYNADVLLPASGASLGSGGLRF